MGSDDIRVVEDFIDAMKAFDFERTRALMTNDIVYQNVPLPADRGREAVERTLQGFTKFVTHFDVVMHHIAERDGVVLTERTDILRGPFVDMEFWVCGTFEVREGKIAVWRDRFDVATAVGQLLLGPLRRLFRPRR
ncbi:MAG: limonene-1,2-epoxide hydrolase family protein [Polyangiaceae bacterium]